jgi:Xaa-Pro aminopeptidase
VVTDRSSVGDNNIYYNNVRRNNIPYKNFYILKKQRNQTLSYLNRMMQLRIFGILLLLVGQGAWGQEIPRILPLRERAILQDQLLEERVRDVLPDLMRKNNVQMWVIIAREYAEDPIIKTMLPSNWLNARRRTILVIYDKGSGPLECWAVARYNVGTLFQKAWNPDQEPDQWKRLAALIAEKNPQNIAINTSDRYAHADGLTHTEYEGFVQRLPENLKSRLVSSERLAVGWLETRTPRELAIYEHLDRITHQIIAEAFSEKVIVPGVTTTEEVVWWMRERVAELKLETWFHPTVDVQRPDPDKVNWPYDRRPSEDVILPGDLLHCDFGITYLRLNTDVQELAYVLRPEEKEAPEYLRKALATGNQLQDILTSFFKVGMTGNQVLALSLRKAEKDGVLGQIYSHPVGYHGHAAGPAIGMWDSQGGVAGTGEYPLNENTAYAIELNARLKIPEWNNKEVRVMLEEQGVFRNGKVYYPDGRQKALLLIPRKGNHLGQ